jgi:hypothetical protein
MKRCFGSTLVILQKFRGNRLRWKTVLCRRLGQNPQGDCPNSPQPHLFTHSHLCHEQIPLVSASLSPIFITEQRQRFRLTWFRCRWSLLVYSRLAIRGTIVLSCASKATHVASARRNIDDGHGRHTSRWRSGTRYIRDDQRRDDQLSRGEQKCGFKIPAQQLVTDMGGATATDATLVTR